MENLTLGDLPDHDTIVEVEYSRLNYKDALALTDKGKIVRTWPVVPGIDFACADVEQVRAGNLQGRVLVGVAAHGPHWKDRPPTTAGPACRR